MNLFNFIINIIFWYGFTILSTIYSKKYLNLANDSHTLTIITFAYPALFKLITSNLNTTLKYMRIKPYVCLALFNIGTILLTNIGMNETSVSLTYMVKASEPLFVLLLSYYILEEGLELVVHLTLIPICVGVILIVYGEIEFNSIGFLCAFSANLTSASRNVFYKSKLKDSAENSSHSHSSPFVTYLNVGFVSFIYYAPFYLLRWFVTSLNRQNYCLNIADQKCLSSYYNQTSMTNIFPQMNYSNNLIIYLLFGSLFNFLYNLFSFRVLSNISPISHSIINIMKRVFIVFSSMAIFATRISSVQVVGMLCADAGVFLYSYFKLKSQVLKVTISNEKKELYKSLIVFLTIIMILSSCFISSSHQKSDAEHQNNDNMRLVCLNKIKTQIKSTFDNYLKKGESVYLVDLPLHNNYGDTLIWLGEEKLVEEFNLTVRKRIASHKNLAVNKTELQKLIKQDDTILLHGGGNFGDLWRGYNDYRNFIISSFPNNKIIIFPQTVNYHNLSLVPYDYGFFKKNKNLTIMVRSFESVNFTKKSFPETNSLYVPDMAFMLGNQVPINKSTHDILVIRRIDKEAKVPKKKWEEALEEVVKGKFTYLVKDWMDYKDLPHKNMMELIQTRLILVNQIISQGRVIICDRLHASIISLLMGKPHIMINEKFNKVINTRESAFDGKPECNQKYIRGFYAQNVNEAVSMAKHLLENNLI